MVVALRNKAFPVRTHNRGRSAKPDLRQAIATIGRAPEDSKCLPLCGNGNAAGIRHIDDCPRMLRHGNTPDDLPDGVDDVNVARRVENADAFLEAPKHGPRVTQSLDVRCRRNLRPGVVIYVHQLRTNSRRDDMYLCGRYRNGATGGARFPAGTNGSRPTSGRCRARIEKNFRGRAPAVGHRRS